MGTTRGYHGGVEALMGCIARDTARIYTLFAMPHRYTTQWSVADVLYRSESGTLDLAPEFQRNSVWPRQAKAYFIDTLMADRPVPLIIVATSISAQSGKTRTSVVDGQQRLRTIIEFVQGDFAVSVPGLPGRRRFKELDDRTRQRLLSYPLLVQVLEEYSDGDIRDVFVRLNKFVAGLRPQELRHAQEPGEFSRFVERLGSDGFWLENRIVTPTQKARMRADEFAAELAILLIEGPQDKKRAVDLYYEFYAEEFPDGEAIESRLRTIMDWTSGAVDLPHSRFRRPVDYYGLVGALDRLSEHGDRDLPDREQARPLLEEFESAAAGDAPPRDVVRYLAAASRQTDNLAPRLTRIATLQALLERA